jgi:hypothetical protein
MNKISSKQTNTKKLKISVTVIKSNRNDWQKYYNKLKKSNKSTAFKLHMPTQNIIKYWKSSD